jgi:SDR family mycofactocin-dependent oxidoreductase
MSGRVEGKVAFVTGAARGQGRAHAVRLAEEGADIIAVDVCEQIATVPVTLGSDEELKETVRLVEDLGRRIVADRADVRDYGRLVDVLSAGVADLGRLDIVVANAGIYSHGLLAELSEDAWQDMIDVNLTGVWHTCKAAVPHLMAGGRGGSIILTSSSVGIRAVPNLGHYAAAKHGVVGLMRSLALELAPYSIRVNSIHPGCVDTAMINNPSLYSMLMPDVEHPTREMAAEVFQSLNALPVPWAEPRDVAHTVLFLASDEARYVTGAALPVDAGVIIK